MRSESNVSLLMVLASCELPLESRLVLHSPPVSLSPDSQTLLELWERKLELLESMVIVSAAATTSTEFAQDLEYLGWNMRVRLPGDI